MVGITGILSIGLIDRERRNGAVDAALEAQAQQIRWRENLSISLPPVEETMPARASLGRALFLARAAQAARTAPLRAQLIARAETQLAQATDIRPFWGEAPAVAAYIHAQKGGASIALARQDLARSYWSAPYMRTAALWRVAFGFQQWDALTPETRGYVVREAVWFGRTGDEARTAIFAMARESTGYRPFIILWLGSRQGDRDFRGFSPAH